VILHLAGKYPCGLFGFSSSGIGDLNADGYQDFAVSEPVSGQAGIAVYWGGPNVDSIADLHLRPGDPSHDADFGALLAPAGDFNGDGFDDVVASARSGTNRFYVFFGGIAPDSIRDLSLSYPAFEYSPVAVAAGDVNHDGYSDLVVGYRKPFSPGRVFVYFGGPGTDALPDLELTASPSDLLPPDAVKPLAIMDWNGDGIPDVIVSSASGFRVYYGGPGMNGSEDFRLTGPTIARQSIRGITSVGDVNGDGAGDLAISTDENGLSGRIQMYFGGTGADSIPDVTLHAQDPAAIFGTSMVSLGDTNADGYADVLVGTNGNDATGGRIDFFLGGAPMDTNPAVSIASPVPNGFGAALGAADVNGDGVSDAIVSLFGLCDTGGTGDVLVYDFSSPLRAHAFAQGQDRTIPVGKDSSPVCIRFEPVGGSYDNADVDMSTIRLVSDATGETRGIASEAAKRSVVADTDGDGVAELPAWFSRSDLAPLFGFVRGRRVVDARLEGQLKSHRRFLAPVTLTILGTPMGSQGVSASVWPNPLNPTGTLRFTTTLGGKVSVRLYDVMGRLIRTILDSEILEAGDHSITVDRRDQRGATLATGVYFYTIESVDGTSRGRIVIAK